MAKEKTLEELQKDVEDLKTKTSDARKLVREVEQKGSFKAMATKVRLGIAEIRKSEGTDSEKKESLITHLSAMVEELSTEEESGQEEEGN